MSASNIVNIEVNQKSSFLLVFNIKENGSYANLENYTAVAKFKPDAYAPDSKAVDFTAEVTNAATGEVTISLTADQTSSLTPNQRYIYDLAIIDGTSDFKTRVVEGHMKVSPGVA